jgi:hypothetical protein
MVARIKTGKNMLGALNYNENKVREGKAKCISENLFGTDLGQLSFEAKRKRFDDQLRLNRRSKTNVVHISLNFAISEKLNDDKLKQIAGSYMQAIGFGEQPYLVYNHFDAAHPHIHILTTSIQQNGKRIPLHNLGRVQSENARKEVERTFGLKAADTTQKSEGLFTDLRKIEPVTYGKAETKAAISKIVGAVTRSYKYTSIPELNAVLRQFNVVADRGSEGTRMFEKKGLVYSIINEKGEKVGVPIKASSIYGKPTIANLEKQFKLNEALRTAYKTRIQEAIENRFRFNEKQKVTDFVNALKKDDIAVVFRQNAEGRVYGITFVDNRNRVVFNGSDLGKQYSAKAIMEKLRGEIPIPPIADTPSKTSSKIQFESGPVATGREHESALAEHIKDLFDSEKANQAVESGLVRKRRKKRRRRSL